MDVAVLVLILFGALGCAFGAILFGALDVVSARRAAVAAKVAVAGPRRIRLQRMPRATVNPQAGPISRFDSWFLQIVRETGMGVTPLAAALLLVFCGTLIGGMLFIVLENPLIVTGGVAIGMAAALVYLLVRRARRIKQLQEQLPIALDMLARSIRAGESIDQAMELIGTRSAEPLATEFRQCARQLSMGLSMPAVMRSLVERVRLVDVRIFTTTLSVHRRTGGNLATVLERLAMVVRERLDYRRQLRVSTGAGRFSAILIGMIGPLLFAYLLIVHPQYVEKMLVSPLGQSLLVVAFVLEVVGLVWTARLMKPTL